ncbi:MAG: T9SS type B sorting domain-containing protein [Crocinitomix sp.]|nr:T9SS type B sorting domain-containing protein [Crocinitomix sp.]
MNFLKTFCILASFCFVINSQATIILVENVNDAGIGSLRQAVADASPSAGDTILINVKGTFVLDSPIEFDSFTALTVIGPYSKHNTITAGAGWTGSLFHISNSEGITFQSLGFESGNGNTRHITIEDSPNDIIFERCMFQDNDYTLLLGQGGSVRVINSTASFSQCSFIENQATDAGAMVAEAGAEITLTNCTFSGNTASGHTGALLIKGTSTAILLFNTFVNNDAASVAEAVRANGTTNITLGNNAVGNNGTGRQMRLNGGVVSLGRNIIKQNYPTEPINLTPMTGDIESDALDLGIRTTILEDGYGLKYWPITDATSDLINPASPGGTVPDFDCRNAPRNLKGPSATNAYPDAGACEYTHLRVTNDVGTAIANSFLGVLAVTPKDAMHYIEFDISSPTDISLGAEGVIDGGAYIIDGFSQAGSSIPGPHQIGTAGVTPPLLLIDLVNGGSHNHGIKFEFSAEGSIVQGLSVQGFDRHGLEANQSDDISFFGCEVGIDDAGAENGNARAGIRLNSNNNTIGGWEHWMRNTVSGNGLSGSEKANIYISFGNNSNTIKGNIIGGSPDGMSGIAGPPTTNGIYVASWYNKIGGTLPNEGNIMIDNEYGSYHPRTGDFTTYCGNLIGLAYDESTAVGNSIAGISFNGCDDNQVGGYTDAAANKIAHNGSGIQITFATTIAERNTVVGNSIYANDFQGIDISANGTVLTNDGVFDGFYSNQGIDFPELTESTACDGSSTITTFILRVPPTEDYRVEFFTNTSPDATNGEGETLIDVTTISVVSNPQTIVYDHGFDIGTSVWLTATVTQISSGNTSEFGTNVLTTTASSDPSISYNDICPWETASPNFDGDMGGVFKFSDPVPVDGATIDAATGDIIGALEGITYEVIYGFSGACADEDTTEFTVTIIDETFTMSDFCPGANGTATGIVTPGGTFSLNPDFGDGASITADSGILSGGVEGTTYTVQYIADDGTCKDTGYVDVFVTITDETFTMADFCAEVESAPAVPVTGGGVFSFSPDPGDGATINPSTGAVTGGVEGATYMISYVVGSCSEEHIISVNVIAIDESFTFANFCPGTVGMPADVVVAGGFSFLTPPGDGAIINTGTGFITGGTEGTTYEVLHTVGTCDDKDTLYPMMIEVLEEFTYADFCIDGDSSTTFPVADDPANSYYILVGASFGETINSSTGTIYGVVEGEIYTVVDSVHSSGCSQTDTVTVTSLNIDESFTMADFCPEVVSADAIPVVPGGAFSFAPDPADGATINPATGAITGGVEGATYEVRYVVGSCDEEDTISVNVIAIDESFTFPNFCPGTVGMPTDVVVAGGFSFLTPPGDGSVINPGTGFITGGTEGTTYDVVHTVGTCDDKDTLYPMMIVVLEEFTYADFCIDGDSSTTFPVADDPANSYYILVGASFGETINSSTGTIYGVVEGEIYTVVDSVNSSGCWQADTVTVTSLNIDESFTMEDFCPIIESAPAVTITGGGVFSFSPDPGDGATINPATGAVTGGVEGATYVISYIVGTCDEEHIDSASVIAIDESFTFPNFCPGTVGMPDEVVVDGGFSFLTPPGDAAVIDPGTGFITGGTEDTTYAVLHTVGFCNDSDTLFPKMYKVLEEFTYDDFCIIGDSSSTLPMAEDSENASYSLVGPLLFGETIDPVTGTIHSPEEGVTYTVVNTNTTTFGVIECTQTDTFYVTAILIPEAFSYDNYCFEGTGSPYDYVAGGTFSLVGGPYVGVTIDPLTGDMTGGLDGDSYTIRYVYEIGDCADSSEVTISIVLPDASFTFPDFCPGLLISPEPTALFGSGTWDFEFDPLDGASINFLTGAISDPIESNLYSVVYTLEDTVIIGCFNSDTMEVMVKIVNEGFSYENFCWESSSEPAEVLEGGGILAFGTPGPIDGATLDDEGIIENATEGTVYEIVHTLTTDGCTQSDSVLVTALGVDESFIFDDYCAATYSPAPIATTDGGTYIFAPDPADGATINVLTGVITNGIEGSSYEVMYSVNDTSGACNESDTVTVYVKGSDESFSIDNFCAEFPSDSPIPAVGSGTYTFEPDPADGAVIDPITGIITSADPGATYGVMYTLMLDGCTESDTNEVIAYASEVAEFTTDSYCANIPTAIEITGTPGGTFEFDPSPAEDGATIDPSTGVINGSVGGTYDVTYFTPGSATTCADTITKTITLYDIPSIIEISSDVDLYCPDETLGAITVTENFAASQIYWYIGDSGGDISDSSFTYTPENLTVGENTFYAKPKSSEGCYGEYASYIIYLSDTSGMGAISDFDICRGSAAQLWAYGGASYIWHTDVPLEDYTNPEPIAISLNEEAYVVSIYNDDGCQVMDTIRVRFKPQNECLIDINNAFSPNGDGKNDFWYIDNLINYLPNTVYIYSRWGDEVQKITNYDNVTITKYWDGKDKHGNELPPNTYFYVVITEGSDQSQAGWVQLVR